MFFCIIKLEIIKNNLSSFLLCYYVQNGTEKKVNYSDEIPMESSKITIKPLSASYCTSFQIMINRARDYDKR